MKQQQKPSQKVEQKPANKSSAKKDNPYARPFGRMSMDELEKSIAETERNVADTEKRFAAVSGSETKRLRGEYDALTEKLQALEAEYYTRSE